MALRQSAIFIGTHCGKAGGSSIIFCRLKAAFTVVSDKEWNA